MTTVHPVFDPLTGTWFIPGRAEEAPTIRQLLAALGQGHRAAGYHPNGYAVPREHRGLPAEGGNFGRSFGRTGYSDYQRSEHRRVVAQRAERQAEPEPEPAVQAQPPRGQRPIYDREQFRELAVRLPVRDVCLQLNLNPQTAYRLCAELGITPVRAVGRPVAGAPRYDHDRFAALVKTGMPVARAAEKVGMTRANGYLLIKKLGLTAHVRPSPRPSGYVRPGQRKYDYETILDLWFAGMTAPEIAAKLGIRPWSAVTNVVWNARRRSPPDPRAVTRAAEYRRAAA